MEKKNKNVGVSKEVVVNGESKYLESNKEIGEYEKDKRIFLFLLESSNLNKEEIERRYINKFNLSKRSMRFNGRILDRFMGEGEGVFKWSKEKKEERKKLVKESISKLNIDYKGVVEKYKRIKNKMGRKNILNSMEINI